MEAQMRTLPSLPGNSTGLQILQFKSVFCGFDSTSYPNLKRLIFQNRWELSWQILIKLTCERQCYLIAFEAKLSQNDKSFIELFVRHLPCQSCSSSRWMWELWALSGGTVWGLEKIIAEFFLVFFSFCRPNQGDFCVVLDFIAKEQLSSLVASQLSCTALI